jgi:enoyl-CoA hydratase/carnithine racemase
MTDDYIGQALDWSRTDDIITVTLHGAPCNEIGTVMLDELERLADHIRAGANGARALVWTSQLQSGFSAGADLRELHGKLRAAHDARERISDGMKKRLPGTQTLDSLVPMAKRGAKAAVDVVQLRPLKKFIERIHRVFDTFDETPLTTVAAIHGVCFGGGFELALTADILIAEKNARFAFPELRLGLIPGFGGIPRLERDVGNAVVRDLLLTGRSLRAKRAYEVGLVSQMVGSGKAIGVAHSVAN